MEKDKQELLTKKAFYYSKIGQFAKILYYNELKKSNSSFKGKVVALIDDDLILENLITEQSGSFNIKDIKSALFEPIVEGGTN